MAQIIYSEKHILEQVSKRYKITNPEEMLRRVVNALENQTPPDWRFTQSPTARFFVVDYETQVKIMGFSYRDWGQELVKKLQTEIRNDRVQNFHTQLAEWVKEYLDGLCNPDVQVVHDLRTAYDKKGEIGEEKKLVTAIREELDHVIPLSPKKLSARPNAVVMSEEELWVRQYINWMNLADPNKEFFLFKRLTSSGINKCHRKIFSATSNGEVKIEDIRVEGCPHGEGECLLKVSKSGSFSEKYRTDAYWTLPTYLDRRMTDLDFRNREPEKAASEGEGPLTRDELVELWFLRLLVQAAQDKFKK